MLRSKPGLHKKVELELTRPLELLDRRGTNSDRHGGLALLWGRCKNAFGVAPVVLGSAPVGFSVGRGGTGAAPYRRTRAAGPEESHDRHCTAVSGRPDHAEASGEPRLGVRGQADLRAA